MAWNGYRVSRVGGGGGLNGHFAPKAKQVWEVGNIVNAGFVKNLKIISKSNGEYNLIQEGTGKRYGFRPHSGVYLKD